MDFFFNLAHAAAPGTPITTDAGAQSNAFTQLLLAFGLSGTMLVGFLIVIAIVAFAVLSAVWAARRRLSKEFRETPPIHGHPAES